MGSVVGAGILSVITESLYDNPIVVFREYVQNSVDSIFKRIDYKALCRIEITYKNGNLMFIDNGAGISKEEFKDEMIKISASRKSRQSNLGYKGIGRLSGIPYCEELIFVNITDYKNHNVQVYRINCEEYNNIKKDVEYHSMGFEDVMNRIGRCEEISIVQDSLIDECINRHHKMLEVTNTGFLVVLRNLTSVLKNIVVKENDIVEDLEWLLPINFKDDLFQINQKDLFEEMVNVSFDGDIPVKYCDIFYNGRKLFRPITSSMLRQYVCKCDFQYAIGFHSFDGNKIAINKNNTFSGIRIYMDNMLLCDESELLSALENYGLLRHTKNGLLQTVRGIGAMIYITDKVNISSNARRTFIEVTDDDALKLLKLLAQFLDVLYDTRYALSNYASQKAKHDNNTDKLNGLRNEAVRCMQLLARETIELQEDQQEDFNALNDIEKKKIIKKRIVQNLDDRIKEYLKDTVDYDKDNAFKKFLVWLFEKDRMERS